MDVVASSEYRYDRTPDGSVWTQTVGRYAQWTRFLGVFDACTVLARIRDVPEPPEGGLRADGEGVSFLALPHYHGPTEYLRKRRAVRDVAAAFAAREAAAILEVPSVIAWHIADSRVRLGSPFAVRVVGDPLEAFGRGGLRHPLRPLLRSWFAARQRHHCRTACAAAYVTRESLQRRYPAAASAFTESWSDVELDEAAFAERPRRCEDGAREVLTVASLEVDYKRVDLLLEAVARLRDRGTDVRLTVAGDGSRRPPLEALASRLRIDDRVRFLGWVRPGPPLRAVLDAADLFVLASITEGLPRAMIEAMARGVPCIGTRVGGIPELLDEDELVPTNDSEALAAKLAEVLRSGARREAASARNLRRAEGFLPAVIAPRRQGFYEHVKSVTADWLSGR